MCCIWRGITAPLANPGSVLSQQLRPTIDDGSRVSFWSDLWIDLGPLKSTFPRIFALAVRKFGVVVDFGSFVIMFGFGIFNFVVISSIGRPTIGRPLLISLGMSKFILLGQINLGGVVVFDMVFPRTAKCGCFCLEGGPW
ncbi:hypothetical protein V6N13_140716 [Hibiscus sabdariffa]